MGADVRLISRYPLATAWALLILVLVFLLLLEGPK
jgi:hypothetical protein